VRDSRDEIRLRFEKGGRRRSGNQGIGDRIVRHQRRVWNEQLEFVSAGSRTLVVRRLAVMMTRLQIIGRHAARSIGRITACESARGRAFRSAKSKRHDKQYRELIGRPDHLSRS
jgi:hypothetical protein